MKGARSGTTGSDPGSWRDIYGWRWLSRAFRDAFGNFRATTIGVVGPTAIALVVLLVSSDAQERLDAFTQLRWLVLGVIGSAAIAALVLSVRLIRTPSVLDREQRAAAIARENEVIGRLQGAQSRIDSLQRELEALPVLDLEVRVRPNAIAAVDDTEASRESWLDRELAAFKNALAREKPSEYSQSLRLGATDEPPKPTSVRSSIICHCFGSAGRLSSQRVRWNQTRDR